MSSTEHDSLLTVERRMESLERHVITLLTAIQEAQRLGALGVLTATVAHEINNILTPVQGYAQSALARPHDTELTTRALQRAAEGAARGSQIARSILALAGQAADAESGGVATSVDGAIAEALDHTTLALNESGVQVLRPPPSHAFVTIPKAGLVQVIQNLLLNAIHALRGRDGRIRVGVRVPAPTSAVRVELPSASASVELTISDNGPGLSPRSQESLFRPFASGDSTHQGSQAAAPKRSLGGSGLGLSICKGLVEAAGGRIVVDSVLGEGATFRILLPSAAAPDPAGSPPNHRPSVDSSGLTL